MKIQGLTNELLIHSFFTHFSFKRWMLCFLCPNLEYKLILKCIILLFPFRNNYTCIIHLSADQEKKGESWTDRHAEKYMYIIVWQYHLCHMNTVIRKGQSKLKELMSKHFLFILQTVTQTNRIFTHTGMSMVYPPR